MKTLSTFILLISILQLTAQTTESNELQSALSKLKQTNSQTNQRKFFELFPSSFESFEETFGFKNGKAAPLYDGHEYVVKFFSLDSIPEREQIKKWIDISIGGQWDADAVNYFQHFLRSKVFKNIDLTYEFLKERPKKEIEGFFYFFFNEIHPQFETMPQEFEMIKNRDKEFYSLLVKGHKRAIEDSGH